jgi:hypothetical protein
MAHTRRTLLLDRKKWDLALDGTGRIALANGDYATAQNVANETRLFTNDAYFIQDKGTPYFAVSLGQRTNQAIVRSYLRRAALRAQDVKEILSIRIVSVNPETRTLTGDIHFTTVEGGNGAVSTEF